MRSICSICNALVYATDPPHKCNGERLARSRQNKLIKEIEQPMTTPKLPLRDDGGIDWDKFMPEITPEVLRLAFVGVARDSAAATLERMAKWHEEQERFWGRCISARKEDEQTPYDVFVRGTIETHKRSAAAIRAMKP